MLKDVWYPTFLRHHTLRLLPELFTLALYLHLPSSNFNLYRAGPVASSRVPTVARRSPISKVWAASSSPSHATMAAHDAPTGSTPPPKRAKTDAPAASPNALAFHPSLFEPANVERLALAHTQSHPYQHGLVDQLFEPAFLHKARKEIVEQIAFREKETDICASLRRLFRRPELTVLPCCRQGLFPFTGSLTSSQLTSSCRSQIAQTGDLTNLSGLPADELALLPTLLQLRDSLYSPTFRSFVQSVTGCGPLSGIKTDMSCNECAHAVAGRRQIELTLHHHCRRGGLLPLEPRRRDWDAQDQLHPVPRLGRAQVGAGGASCRCASSGRFGSRCESFSLNSGEEL